MKPDEQTQNNPGASAPGLFIVSAAGMDSLPGLACFLFVGFGFLGLVLPTTTVLALEHHGPIAGTASALMGCVQMVTGAAVMALAGLFANGTPLPMTTAIAACACTAFLLAQLALRRPQREAQGE